MLDHDLRCLAEQLVAIGIVERLGVAPRRFLRFLAADRLDNVGLRRRLLEEEPLRLVRSAALVATEFVPPHQTLGVLARDVGALQSRRFRFRRRNEEHVAVTEQRFGANAIEDGAAVDLRRHTESDAAREVRLDQTGDDVHARTLRRQNAMDPDRARFLRQHC